MLSGVTYNVFLGKRFKILFDWLLAENPWQDMYCFQEFPEDKIEDLKKLFVQQSYTFTFAPGWIWQERVFGELTVCNNRTLKNLKTETASLGGRGKLFFILVRDGMRFDTKIARAGVNRTALVTRFTFQDKPLTIVNTHLSADILNKQKLRQSQIVIDHLGKDSQAIVLGDFNYPFGQGLQKLMLKNGLESKLNQTPTYEFLPGIYWQNDFIFQRGCNVQNIEVKKVTHSDHYPIFFKISL